MLRPSISVPILESGDRLTRAEFHRRYCARSDIQKAELVEGVVYVASPFRASVHGIPDTHMQTWLGTFASRRPELKVAGNVTLFLDTDNEVQPDVCLWRETDGGPRLNEEGYLEGAPQFVIEIAASSAAYDLHDKLHAYRRNGVPEYVVWRTLDAAIDWFRLREGIYERVEPDDRGLIESEQFPGLRLHVQKMLDGDLAGVLAEL